MSDDLDQGTNESPGGTVPLRIVGFDDVAPVFATSVHVTNEVGAFQLVFSQFLQPVILSSADFAPLADQGYAPVRVVARVVLTPQTLAEAISVLQQQLRRYQERESSEGGGIGGEDEV